jgi:hypothetical protein
MASKKSSITLVTLTIIAISLAAASSAILSDQQTPQPAYVPNMDTTNGTDITNKEQSINGTINSGESVNVYIDEECILTCSQIEWGEVEEGETVQRWIYIKNTSNANQTLSMETSDWQPVEASSVLSVSWDKEGYILEPSTIVEAKLILKVAQDVGEIDTFDFDLTIQGIT